MEFTIKRSELLAGLYLTQGIVERRTTVPILGNVLIGTYGEGVIVSATDQELAVRRQCVATVKKNGMLTTGARRLYEMVRELDEGDVCIRALENSWIEVMSGRSYVRLVGLDAREFPAMPDRPVDRGDQVMQVSAETLREMIEHTVFAVSGDETRMNLNGVYLECVEPGLLRMVATDGHRLAMITRPIEGVKPGAGVIVPRKAVMELRKVLESGDEPIELSVYGGIAHAQRGAVQMSMRLVEGEFPDYQQVIPARPEQIAVVKGAALLAGLRRVSIVSSERTRGIKLQLEGQRLDLSSINPDVGEATEEMEVEYAGPPVGIGFNGRYLMEVLAVLPDDARIEIGLNDDVSPAVVGAVGDPDYCYIVMPMRL